MGQRRLGQSALGLRRRSLRPGFDHQAAQEINSMKKQARSFLFAVVFISAGPALAAGLPHTFTAGTPAIAEEVNENFRYVAPLNVVYVNAVEGGTEQDNGQALLEALDPATLEAINGLPAADNPYLIKLGPGRFDLGTASARLAPHVHLAGAGKNVSWVKSDISNYLVDGGTITLANDTSVSQLSLIGAAPGTNTAILADGTKRAAVRDVVISLSGATTQVGITVVNEADVEISDISLHHVMSGGLHGGITIEKSAARLDNIAIDMRGYGQRVIPIQVTDDSAVRLRNIAIEARNTSASGFLHGLAVRNSNVNLQNGYIYLTGANTDRYPLWLNGGSLTVNHSAVINSPGSAAEFFMHIGAQGGQVRIGASHLAPHYYHYDSGTKNMDVKCAYIYESSYTQVGGCTAGIL